MNRRRTDGEGLGFGSVVLLVGAAVVTAGSGIFHAYVKNRQIRVSREIEAAEQRIVDHELQIRTVQMLLDEQMNRYLIRDRLRRIASGLRPIPVTAVEEVDPRRPEGVLPDLARGGP